jgi:uncharacterized protein (TIGR03000 family)
MRRTFMVFVVGLAASLVCPESAKAQIVIQGDSYRINIGTPPPDFRSTSTGNANYPGSNGFVPGFGYGPNFTRDWPTLREAWANRHNMCPNCGQADQTTRLVPAATPGPAPLPMPMEVKIHNAPAIVSVRLPKDAELLISNQATTQKGEVRAFVTPPLPGGKDLYYDLIARWKENGKAMESKRRVVITSGARVEISMTGAEPLPAPQLMKP